MLVTPPGFVVSLASTRSATLGLLRMSTIGRMLSPVGTGDLLLLGT